MDTTSIASSSTDAPDPDDGARDPADGARGTPTEPPIAASAPGTPTEPRAAPPGAATPAPTHDPDRRAFFRVFGRQAAQTVAQVAGMASAVSQLPVNALTGLAELTAPTQPAPLPAARPAPSVVADAAYRSPYRLADDAIHILDQRKLPDSADEQLCRRGADVAYYLRVGAARGGPLMAQLASYGLAFSAREMRERSLETRRAELQRVGRALAQARTGSRQLRWAVDRAWALADSFPDDATAVEVADALRADADARAADADLDHATIGRALEELLPHPERRALEVLIHGDPGALSAGLVGPLTAALTNRIAAGGQVRVWVTESRPGLEGARLASWELANLGIEHLVLPDAAVGALLEREQVDAIVLAGDWVAANGDTGGMVGGRVVAGMAATASRGAVPVFVAAPITAFEPTTLDGSAIPVEDRPTRDLQTYVMGTRLPRVRGWNRGNDVVPAAWIERIVTEMGVFAPTDAEALTAALDERESRRRIERPRVATAEGTA